jgi:hypothetical protein
MERVSLAFSICLSNGNPVEEFHLRRGVHQRDHLSPFLSIIDVEGLHILLKASSEVGLLKEYFFHLRRGVHQRDHLSPFLSIIDVEGLHILLKASSKVGLLKEYFFYISSRVIRLGRMMILSFSLRTYSLQIIR